VSNTVKVLMENGMASTAGEMEGLKYGEGKRNQLLLLQKCSSDEELDIGKIEEGSGRRALQTKRVTDISWGEYKGSDLL
jgi:hypothetical protein